MTDSGTNDREFELDYGGRLIVLTAYPPMNVEQGRWWWVRVDDNWLRLRECRHGETNPSPELDEEVRRFMRDIFLATGEHRRAPDKR